MRAGLRILLLCAVAITGAGGCVSDEFRERDCFQAYLVVGARDAMRDAIECWYIEEFAGDWPEMCLQTLEYDNDELNKECRDCSSDNTGCTYTYLDAVDSCGGDEYCEQDMWEEMGNTCANSWFDGQAYFQCGLDAELCVQGVQEPDADSAYNALIACVDEWEACEMRAITNNTYDNFL